MIYCKKCGSKPKTKKVSGKIVNICETCVKVLTKHMVVTYDPKGWLGKELADVEMSKMSQTE